VVKDDAPLLQFTESRHFDVRRNLYTRRLLANKQTLQPINLPSFRRKEKSLHPKTDGK